MAAESFRLKDKTFLSLSEWDRLVKGLTLGFTTKNGGISGSEFSTLNLGLHVNDRIEDVLENRLLLANKLSFPINSWVFAEQVHSNKIKKVSKQSKGKGSSLYEDGIEGSDGIYTAEKGIMLSLCFADCVPLYFIAPKKNLIGLAHAGWKGTVKDIGGEMVRKWQLDEGVEPSEIKVAIGPSIEECCYIVDDKVISSIEQTILERGPVAYKQISAGQYRLDLKMLNKHYLVNAGIKEDNIVISSQCTSCESQLFFSHRRDKGKTGRMLSFIGINEEAYL